MLYHALMSMAQQNSRSPVTIMLKGAIYEGFYYAFILHDSYFVLSFSLSTYTCGLSDEMLFRYTMPYLRDDEVTSIIAEI